MKYLLFLTDLAGLTRESTIELIRSASINYEPIWNGDSGIDRVRGDVEILVTSDHKLTSDDISAWPNLKMISAAFTGYDEVDLEYARSKEIQVYYVPGYATASVAELNVALTLSILRRIVIADRTIREGQWHDQVYPGTELANKTVGILGTGTIGLKTAQLFRAFGCSIVGWSRTLSEEFIQVGGAYVSSKAVFAESDIVILCLALTDDTHHFVGKTELDLMKRGAVLINTARSRLVDKSALLSVLADKRIFAGIDVFESDPERGGDDLFGFQDNVVLTPHLGFKTTQALRRLAERAIFNISNFVQGNRTNRLV